MPPTRRAPAALVALLTGAALAASPTAPAGADDDPLECWTLGLTDEEIEDDLTSVVVCDEEPPSFLLSATLAIHYDATNGNGAQLSVLAPTCDHKVKFVSTDWWNDRISSTRHISCGNIKHFVNNQFTGTHQLVQGVYGDLHNLNGTLNDQTSSIGYG